MRRSCPGDSLIFMRMGIGANRDVRGGKSSGPGSHEGTKARSPDGLGDALTLGDWSAWAGYREASDLPIACDAHLGLAQAATMPVLGCWPSV